MTRVDELRALTEDLERHLGDPHDADGPVSFATSLDLDEREQYPHGGLDVLRAWGCHDFGVPVSAGGRGVATQDSVAFGTTIARRDATLATALSITMLAYLPIWVGGDDEQRARYGEAVHRGAKFAWGLTEREHGSDVLATGMTARRVEGGYVVDGEKWLIGHGTQADYVVLFVRTGERAGPAGFSILVLDRRATPAHCISALPDEQLHGLRGIDMSGLRLTDCFIPDSARIGPEGHGLEIALTGSHPVRVMITGIALGCTDTALRLALDFTTQREIFGGTVVDVPYSRRKLVEAHADLLLSDTLANCAARSLQTSPDQSAVWSSVAKYLVPTVLDRTVAELGVVLGARHYLRGHHRYGMFQKARRDLLVANFADGNTVVNLKNVATALPSLLAPAGDAATAAARERARALFDWDAELPPIAPWAAQTAGRTGDDALHVLPDAIAALARRAEATEDPVEADRWRRCAELGRHLGDELDWMRAECAALQKRLGRAYGSSAELFTLAERFCVLHAVATCLAHRALSSDWIATPMDGAAPLLMCLHQLWARLYPLDPVATPDDVEAAARVLLTCHAEGRSFGYRQFALAKPAGAPDAREVA
ncbi:acyl-CoA dehydrogenase family protein [Actinomycetospora aeridis]|uniref:Acyl-CoA dehydrogenase family protein n=1 Tax=Actinomycetospora aeridis TaxID=3129231 RepID=A0ABU8N835_9PSEU